MPSLYNRPNGIKVLPTKATKGNIVLKTNSKHYSAYMRLRSDDKAVLDTILALMGTDNNQLVIAEDTLNLLSELSGYVNSSILSSTARLHKEHFINATKQLDSEYIVNPLFAYKGSEEKIWQFIQSIHYKGDTPREAILQDYELNH